MGYPLIVLQSFCALRFVCFTSYLFDPSSRIDLHLKNNKGLPLSETRICFARPQGVGEREYPSPAFFSRLLLLFLISSGILKKIQAVSACTHIKPSLIVHLPEPRPSSAFVLIQHSTRWTTSYALSGVSSFLSRTSSSQLLMPLRRSQTSTSRIWSLLTPRLPSKLVTKRRHQLISSCPTSLEIVPSRLEGIPMLTS